MLVLPLPLSYLAWMGAWVVALVAAFFGLLKYRRACRRVPGRRLLWANAGLSLAMLLAVITAAELGFACFADFSDTFNITNVSKRWLVLHIDAERNADGFRDRNPLATYVPKGVRRIVFLGDSFTAGHGVRNMEHRFTDRIAAWLEAARPGAFAVANLGEPGYEVSMIAGLARALFTRHTELSVLVYVYNLNDIEGYDDQMKAALAQIYTGPPSLFLFRDTYLLNWLYFRFVQFRHMGGESYFEKLAASYRSSAWEGVRAKLSEMRRDCAEHHVDFRLVIFPFLQDLGPDYPLREAHEKIVDFCKSQQIPVLDLEPDFRQHASERLMVSRFDAHPNERAHAIAAEAIEKGLLGDLLSPAK